MARADDRRLQLLFVAGHALMATRLQRERVERGMAHERHDVDFWMLSAWRLREVARLARDRLPEPYTSDVRSALATFDAAMPHLSDLRHWWLHPPDPTNHLISWTGRSVVALRASGVEYLVDVRDHQGHVERLYQELESILGPLPDCGPFDPRL